MEKFVRLWINKKTGKYANYKVDEDYVKSDLVYDQRTRILYYKFSELITVNSNFFEEQEPFDTKVGYMSPYITENGKLCRMTENIEFVEIG